RMFRSRGEQGSGPGLACGPAPEGFRTRVNQTSTQPRAQPGATTAVAAAEKLPPPLNAAAAYANLREGLWQPFLLPIRSRIPPFANCLHATRGGRASRGITKRDGERTFFQCAQIAWGATRACLHKSPRLAAQQAVAVMSVHHRLHGLTGQPQMQALHYRIPL